MITIQPEKCSHCGLCADLCHESCITMTAKGPQIDQETCSTCTQCIAACPTRALAWDGAIPAAFERQRLPKAEQLDELFRERRSIRRFKRDKIDRALLEEIALYGGYAPTHAFSLRAIIVDDGDLIAALDQTIVGNCRWIHRLVYQLKVGEILAAWFGYADEMKKARPKIEATLRQDHAFHSMPTAFIFVVGDKNVPLSEASAQYALANMMYYAQVKGVGTCLWANGPIFIDKHRLARRQLGIGPKERIFGAMYMGYPAARFSNKVAGKKMNIQWNGAIGIREETTRFEPSQALQ
jgi:nitroreductase/NAD-dependent dihydropyrimidine dehydrogenase PreA subunit